MSHEAPRRPRSIRPLYVVLLLGVIYCVWDPETYSPLLSRLGLTSLPVHSPKNTGNVWGSQTRGLECQREPCAKARDAWAILPTGVPHESAVTYLSWTVCDDLIAFGLRYEAGLSCLDPQDVVDSLGHQVFQRHGSPPTALPPPSECRDWAKMLGVEHLIIPVVGPKEGMPTWLAYYRADESSGFAPTEVARNPVAWNDHVAGTEALMSLGLDVVRKLGGRPARAVTEVARKSLMPPPPDRLLERLAAAGQQLSLTPTDPGIWAQAGLDAAMLGYYLCLGRSPYGPKLLVRGAAMTALASGLAPEDGAVLLARSTALLLSRETSLAVRVLSPLLAKGDATAKAVEQACHSMPARLDAEPSNAFLYRVAVDRADDRRDLSTHVERLVKAGLPLDFVLAGAASEFAVGDAHRYTRLWLVHAEAAVDSSSHSPEDSTASKQLIDRAMQGDLTTNLRRRHAGAVPAKWAANAAFEPLAGPVIGSWSEHVRADLQAMPYLEYSRFATIGWSVAEEARRVLDAVKEALPDSKAWSAAESTYRRHLARRTFVLFAQQWWREDTCSPWAAYDALCASVWDGRKDEDSSALEYAKSFGVCCPGIIHALFDYPTDAHVMAPWLEGIRFDVAIDPWDAAMRAHLIEGLADSATLPKIQKDLTDAQTSLPQSARLSLLEGQILLDRGCPLAARRAIRRGVERFPQEWSLWQKLIESHTLAHDFVGAISAAQEAVRTYLEPLGNVSLLCSVADDLLLAGAHDLARPLVEQAKALEEWKGDAIVSRAHLAICEGRSSEGEEWFKNEVERYGTNYDAIFKHVAAYLQVGRKEDALRTAEVTYRKQQDDDAQVQVMIAYAFLYAGDIAHGRDYLVKAQQKNPGALDFRGRVMLAHPELVASLRYSRDRGVLSQWLPVIDREADGDQALEALADNRSAAAFAVLLQGVALPRIGRQCAVRLASKAGIDLDLDYKPTPEALEAAHQRLVEWWRQNQATYESRQFPATATAGASAPAEK